MYTAVKYQVHCIHSVHVYSVLVYSVQVYSVQVYSVLVYSVLVYTLYTRSVTDNQPDQRKTGMDTGECSKAFRLNRE